MTSGSDSAGDGSVALRATETLQGHSVLVNLLPHALQTFRREPALAITLSYLLVAMAGIFYNYSFYAKFGIPILSLSQIGDFLVAGIQRPMALVLVLSTFPLCWLLDQLNALRRRRRAVRRRALIERGGDSWWRTLRLLSLQSPPAWFTGGVYVVLIVIYGWTFVSRYADYRADAAKRAEAAQVRVWLNGDASGLSAGQGMSWTYLGAVANYVFLYDPATRRSVALPVNNIARLEPQPAVTDRDKPAALAPMR